MATISLEYPHGTERSDAATKTRSLLEAFKAERPELVKTISWSPDGMQGQAKGRGFSGSFDVTPSHVNIAIDLSLLLRPLKGRVESNLVERLKANFG